MGMRNGAGAVPDIEALKNATNMQSETLIG